MSKHSVIPAAVRSFAARDEGAVLSEYVLLAILIAVVSVGLVLSIGGAVQAYFGGVAGAI